MIIIERGEEPYNAMMKALDRRSSESDKPWCIISVAIHDPESRIIVTETGRYNDDIK